MKKNICVCGLAVACALLGGVCRGASRENLSPRQALLGHWQSGSGKSHIYFGPTKYKMVFGKNEVIKESKCVCSYTIRLSRGDTLKISSIPTFIKNHNASYLDSSHSNSPRKRMVFIEFSKDRNSLYLTYEGHPSGSRYYFVDDRQRP